MHSAPFIFYVGNFFPEKRCTEKVLGDIALYKVNDSDADDKTDFYICNPVYTNIQVEDLFSYVRKDNFEFLENEFKVGQNIHK